MKVFIEKDKRSVEINFEGKLKDLFSRIDINPETVIVMREGELIISDDLVKNSDELSIMSVISGG